MQISSHPQSKLLVLPSAVKAETNPLVTGCLEELNRGLIKQLYFEARKLIRENQPLIKYPGLSGVGKIKVVDQIPAQIMNGSVLASFGANSFAGASHVAIALREMQDAQEGQTNIIVVPEFPEAFSYIKKCMGTQLIINAGIYFDRDGTTNIFVGQNIVANCVDQSAASQNLKSEIETYGVMTLNSQETLIISNNKNQTH